MSVTYGKVVSLILTERFGPVVTKVATFLFKSPSSPLLFITRGTDLPLSKVGYSLLLTISFFLFYVWIFRLRRPFAF